MDTLPMIVGGAAGFIAIMSLTTVVLACFKKCGPNQAMIISGMFAVAGERDFKIVKGGGAIVLPIVQQCALLSLEVMTIEVRSTTPIITADGKSIFVDSVAQVKIEGDANSIATAAELFLSKGDDEIKNIANETIVGHLRATAGTMAREELIPSLQMWAQKVLEVSNMDLNKMGLTVVSFIIREIKQPD